MIFVSGSRSTHEIRFIFYYKLWIALFILSLSLSSYIFDIVDCRSLQVQNEEKNQNKCFQSTVLVHSLAHLSWFRTMFALRQRLIWHISMHWEIYSEYASSLKVEGNSATSEWNSKWNNFISIVGHFLIVSLISASRPFIIMFAPRSWSLSLAEQNTNSNCWIILIQLILFEDFFFARQWMPLLVSSSYFVCWKIDQFPGIDFAYQKKCMSYLWFRLPRSMAGRISFNSYTANDKFVFND